MFLDSPPWEGRERGREPGNPQTQKELTTPKACGESPVPAITAQELTRSLELNKELPKQSDSDITCLALSQVPCSKINLTP